MFQHFHADDARRTAVFNGQRIRVADNGLVAARMALLQLSLGDFEDGRIDGFQFSPQWYAPDYYRDIVDLLIPELQRRGLTRTSYTGRTLRQHLAQNTPN